MTAEKYIDGIKKLSMVMTEPDLLAAYLLMYYIHNKKIKDDDYEYIKYVQDKLKLTQKELDVFLESIYEIYEAELFFRRRN